MSSPSPIIIVIIVKQRLYIFRNYSKSKSNNHIHIIQIQASKSKYQVLNDDRTTTEISLLCSCQITFSLYLCTFREQNNEKCLYIFALCNNPWQDEFKVIQFNGVNCCFLETYPEMTFLSFLESKQKVKLQILCHHIFDNINTNEEKRWVS